MPQTAPMLGSDNCRRPNCWPIPAAPTPVTTPPRPASSAERRRRVAMAVIWAAKPPSARPPAVRPVSVVKGNRPEILTHASAVQSSVVPRTRNSPTPYVRRHLVEVEGCREVALHRTVEGGLVADRHHRQNHLDPGALGSGLVGAVEAEHVGGIEFQRAVETVDPGGLDAVEQGGAGAVDLGGGRGAAQQQEQCPAGEQRPALSPVPASS